MPGRVKQIKKRAFFDLLLFCDYFCLFLGLHFLLHRNIAATGRHTALQLAHSVSHLRSLRVRVFQNELAGPLLHSLCLRLDHGDALLLFADMLDSLHDLQLRCHSIIVQHGGVGFQLSHTLGREEALKQQVLHRLLLCELVIHALGCDVDADSGLQLLDTPGILWPKFEDPEVGMMLAYTGAVKEGVIDVEELACRLMELLNKYYPRTLLERYKVEAPEGTPGWELVEMAGRKRGYLVSGGEVNTERMSKVLLDEFRGGKLGKFTLEMPEEQV